MSDARPPIPTNVMREVRQRCGFGCVLCGTPICEYHHMVPYSESPEHVASNITLLCNLHHTEATKGLLTSDQIARANENPYCRQHGVTSPYSLHFSGEGFAFVIGGNSFSSPWRDQEHSTLAIAIAVDDTDLLWFRVDQDGRLFVNGRNLIVRQASREIFIEIRFEPPDKLCIDRARLLCNGVEILVRSSHIFVVNSDLLFTGCKTVQNCGVGLQLGRNNRGYKAVVNCPKLSRFHLSAPESKKREKLALEGMKKNLEDLRVLVDPEIPT
jgi:trigger factor